VLTVVSSPAGSGEVTRYPEWPEQKYDANDFVSITAIPGAGYVFQKWTGDVSGIPDTSIITVTFQMVGDRTIYAEFTPSDLRYTVIAKIQPSAGGSVKFDPPQPSGGFVVNQSVEVSPVPQDGYVFGHWAGDLGGNDNPATLHLSKQKSITAIFKPKLTTYSSPSQGGVVSIQPDSATGYDTGREVIITAKPAKGYRFVGWEGDASGSSKSITVTMDEPKTIQANFGEKSESRWWLWVVIGVVGLLVGLIVLRLVYARVSRAALGERPFDG